MRRSNANSKNVTPINVEEKTCEVQEKKLSRKLNFLENGISSRNEDSDDEVVVLDIDILFEDRRKNKY